MADVYFAKKEAVDAITACGLHFISRLQKNAVLYYINNEPHTGKRGRPEKFLGKVNQKLPDMKFFTLTTRKSEAEPFSMHNFKVLMHNRLLSERFFRTFAINPNLPKNRKPVEELYGYGLIAA